MNDLSIDGEVKQSDYSLDGFAGLLEEADKDEVKDFFETEDTLIPVIYGYSWS